MANSSSDMLEVYKSQLQLVENSLTNASIDQRDDLLALQKNLHEVISLIQDQPNEKKHKEREQSTVAENTTKAAKSGSDMDAEFARFQMEITGLEGNSREDSDSNSNETGDMDNELLDAISVLEGSKCYAPFIHQWGEKDYHNALVISTDFDPNQITSLESIKVKVMFCNPISESMKPCPFFLDGHCKFSDDKCRYSHGYEVNISELQEFKLPDYSNLLRDSKCLAKYSDDLWYKAVVENCLEDNKYFIKYERFGNTEVVDSVNLLPLDECIDSSDSEVESEAPLDPPSSNDYVVKSADSVQLFLLENSSALGEWEQHTKGMGSKLMAKMGYVPGQGLGRKGDGRLQPIDAMVLPKGKSLDKCIELRERGGRQCPVTVEARLTLEKEKEGRRAENSSRKSRNQMSVFDFLNGKISKIKDDVQRFPNTKQPIRHHSKKVSNKDLIIQSFEIGEEIKKAKREMIKLNESLKRNADKNEVIYAQVKRKVEAQKDILESLRTKEHNINHKMKSQKNHEKLTYF